MPFDRIAGIRAPFFACVGEKSRGKRLKLVLLEVEQAYAEHEGSDKRLNREGLRALMRERMASKASQPPGEKTGPIVISTDGDSRKRG